MLDKEKLQALEEEFSKNIEGIELNNFVWYHLFKDYDVGYELCSRRKV